MDPTELTLTSICGGAVPEVFEREFRELLRNIHDPNTVAEKVRWSRVGQAEWPGCVESRGGL